MDVLWLCNFALPIIAEKIGEKARVNEGWIQGLSGNLVSSNSVGKLVYVFPQNVSVSNITGAIGKIEYIGFHQPNSDPSKAPKELSAIFENILRQYNVDVVHIMGTEYAHSVAMIDAAERRKMINSTVVSIQGMPSVYYKHYFVGIPYNIVKRKRLKDVIYKSDLLNQQRLMMKRGESETYVLRKARNVIGRTEWDAACTFQINETRRYFHGGEILRECFYEGVWKVNNIKRHSIFISQATYPVKGFHLIIEAAGLLIRRYPDLKIYVAGRDIYSGALWKKSSYEKYVRDLIVKNGLENSVEFMGALKAEEMKRRYLKSNVFVSASTIENSPNSVGEAMILGVPTITSDVGGVKDMLKHGDDGFIYPVDETYMLAYYVDRIFSDDGLAQKLGRNARNHAIITHNRERITAEVLDTYKKVSST